MDLYWIGHACFRLRSGNASLLMDPFPVELGLRVPPQHGAASVVTISGGPSDPSAAKPAQGEKPPVVLTGPGEYEAAGWHIKGVRTPRSGTVDDAPLWNTVFIIEAEGVTVCHLGDPARLLTSREAEDLASPHVLLLPVGSKAGLTVTDAVEIVNLVSPRIVVPMLFAHPGNKADLRELGPFLQELGVKEPEPQARLSPSRSSMPEEAQVVVLQPLATLL